MGIRDLPRGQKAGCSGWEGATTILVIRLIGEPSSQLDAGICEADEPGRL